ncbi:chorismate-binding protein [Janibacter melonis]|uniref:chorismate-binding protein n=1 Tax=Janibacter melonis TaxID=262209 RepID=UPI0020953F32|nr:chorismate-binding protein [Janibacter melonis]
MPSAGLDVVCASPEAYLLRDGDRVVSRPIKGTGRVPSDLGAKDHAENVMITDLVRNDLSHVAVPGTVDVEALCALEEHPGLLHLTSDVAARLRPGVGWAELVGATFPPGSVSGAPKSSALQVIRELEPVRRGPYCGAIGWVDADAGRGTRGGDPHVLRRAGARRARPALRHGRRHHVGSDPGQEWRETELKAGRLVGLSSGRVGV